MNEQCEVLIARHAETLSAAIDAVETRKNWSPFKDSPSGKFYAPGKPEAGREAFEAQLGHPFALEQPGIIGWSGTEVSPFTNKPLGIDYACLADLAFVASRFRIVQHRRPAASRETIIAA